MFFMLFSTAITLEYDCGNLKYVVPEIVSCLAISIFGLKVSWNVGEYENSVRFIADVLVILEKVLDFSCPVCTVKMQLTR